MQHVKGKVLKGHRVASGQSGDPRFPEGTLALQKPIFEKLGFPLNEYHQGTINVSIVPHTYEVVQPIRTFRGIKWHPATATEDFSFFNCQIRLEGSNKYTNALVYRPHPDTKPEHFQNPSVLEILAPFIDGIEYGISVDLQLPAKQIALLNRRTS